MGYNLRLHVIKIYFMYAANKKWLIILTVSDYYLNLYDLFDISIITLGMFLVLLIMPLQSHIE